eukprot:CAMPEP_0204172624 /NCGR_PEP_ID=MMETSP0361-20130328/44277_1 /ASSEMBLY_ACC=CAM_ASM_000343 /TAXON_ID=268821 /ORGANISM="Scrippsiella Hangoei, Strain SHTV-5" /LENGTH=240 /DNA_ID=CAMNT_0051130747 /DNA_START=188 /DNA_END=907 /DNA_ORIENTATION=+
MVRAWGSMIFKEAYFHADPHPGNIYVVLQTDPVKAEKMWFLDWGGVCQLQAADVCALATLFRLARSQNDDVADQIVRELDNLGCEFEPHVEDRDKVYFAKMLLSSWAHTALMKRASSGEVLSDPVVPRLNSTIVQVLRVMSALGSYAYMISQIFDKNPEQEGTIHTDSIWQEFVDEYFDCQPAKAEEDRKADEQCKALSPEKQAELGNKLIAAAEEGSVADIKAVTQAGADVNVKNSGPW